jgi:hypothetical protein
MVDGMSPVCTVEVLRCGLLCRCVSGVLRCEVGDACRGLRVGVADAVRPDSVLADVVLVEVVETLPPQQSRDAVHGERPERWKATFAISVCWAALASLARPAYLLPP